MKNLEVRKLGGVCVFGSKMKLNFERSCKQSLTEEIRQGERGRVRERGRKREIRREGKRSEE